MILVQKVYFQWVRITIGIWLRLSDCSGLIEKKRSLVALASKSWTAALRKNYTYRDFRYRAKSVRQRVIITLSISALYESDETLLLSYSNTS